jgi:hypothetical protein
MKLKKYIPLESTRMDAKGNQVKTFSSITISKFNDKTYTGMMPEDEIIIKLHFDAQEVDKRPSIYGKTGLSYRCNISGEWLNRPSQGYDDCVNDYKSTRFGHFFSSEIGAEIWNKNVYRLLKDSIVKFYMKQNGEYWNIMWSLEEEAPVAPVVGTTPVTPVAPVAPVAQPFVEPESWSTPPAEEPLDEVQTPEVLEEPKVTGKVEDIVIPVDELEDFDGLF